MTGRDSDRKTQLLREDREPLRTGSECKVGCVACLRWWLRSAIKRVKGERVMWGRSAAVREEADNRISIIPGTRAWSLRSDARPTEGSEADESEESERKSTMLGGGC